MLAPILVFTADEIWENIPGVNRDSLSVHVETFPQANEKLDTNRLFNWRQLLAYRDLVLPELEEARISKLIGSSLEARVEIKAGTVAHKFLNAYKDQLRYIFIVSQVALSEPNLDLDEEDIRITVLRADGEKCERCWNYSIHVGASSRYPTVCERCVAALEEIESEAV